MLFCAYCIGASYNPTRTEYINMISRDRFKYLENSRITSSLIDYSDLSIIDSKPLNSILLVGHNAHDSLNSTLICPENINATVETECLGHETYPKGYNTLDGESSACPIDSFSSSLPQDYSIRCRVENFHDLKESRISTTHHKSLILPFTLVIAILVRYTFQGISFSNLVLSQFQEQITYIGTLVAIFIPYILFEYGFDLLNCYFIAIYVYFLGFFFTIAGEIFNINIDFLLNSISFNISVVLSIFLQFIFIVEGFSDYFWNSSLSNCSLGGLLVNDPLALISILINALATLKGFIFFIFCISVIYNIISYILIFSYRSCRKDFSEPICSGKDFKNRMALL